jgi:hypothetical protein
MSQRIRLVSGLALAGAVAAGIAACNSDALAPYPQFTINPRAVTVARGASSPVKIVLAGPNKTATWTVTSGNAGVATVAETATGATVTGVAAGTARVYVRAPAKCFPGGEAVDSLTVTVTP